MSALLKSNREPDFDEAIRELIAAAENLLEVNKVGDCDDLCDDRCATKRLRRAIKRVLGK